MAKQSRKKNINKKANRTNKVFWTCLILFLLPFAIFGWMLMSAAMDTGSPILGKRYEGDLDPAITKAELETIKDRTKSISGVEKASINLATATLRVYADIGDLADAEEAKKTASEIYDVVTSTLAPEVYFTKTDTKKMYDMEVHVFNRDTDMDQPGWVYVIETKNSGMEKPITQLVSQPLDAELAEQLRQDVEDRKNPKPEPEKTEIQMTQEGEEVQDDQKE